MGIEKIFVELLQVAMGTRETLSATPTKEQWAELFVLSKTQALTGVAFAAVQKFRNDNDNHIPEVLYLKWLGMVAKIQQRNEAHRRVIGLVSEHLQTRGIVPVFMKGLVCASRYTMNDDDDCRPDGSINHLPSFARVELAEQPSSLNLGDLRQPGDIDFVVRAEDFERTLDALEEIGKVDRTLVHEHHGMAYVSGVQLEPHYKLHNFQHPGVDRFAKGLQEWLFADGERVRRVKIGTSTGSATGAEIPAMPLELEGVFLVSHMVNHVYEEGLGLRQVMDYGFWLMDLVNQDTFDWRLHDEWLKGMRMTRAHRVFVRMCEVYLGVPTNICGYRYTEGEMRFADKLMADILKVGNFGRGAYVFDHSSRWGELRNYLWVCGRAVRLHYLCPAEAWMWPVSKVVRWFGKKMKAPSGSPA